jgi:hypothetical protein
VPNRSNASGHGFFMGGQIMGQTITNSYGDLEVLQAYKNNVKDILKLLITLKIT